MPFNFRLNVQDVFRRLGIQTGARLPQLEENVQLTLQVSDLSRLVPAPIEARGMAGVNLALLAGQHSAVQLHSLAQGGTFVESMAFRTPTFANAQNIMMDVTLTDLALPGVAQNINTGGTPAVARFTAGHVLVPTLGASIPGVTGGGAMVIEPGIFVPNQAFLSVTTSAPGERLDVAMFYRELPAVEEVG